MSRWFRHYAGMMRDEKLVAAAIRSKQPVERVVWVWGAILESASEVNDGGRYDLDAGEASYFLRVDEGDIQNILSALASLGRVSEGTVVRWSDRQFESDQSKDRQKRYRERLKASRDGGVTSRDGKVTAQEADTDTEPSEDARAASVDPDFERFWDAYPNKTGRPSAEKAFSQALKRSSIDEIMAGVRSYAAKTDDRQWCSPVKWLSDDRWNDRPAPLPGKPASPIAPSKLAQKHQAAPNYGPAEVYKPPPPETDDQRRKRIEMAGKLKKIAQTMRA